MNLSRRNIYQPNLLIDGANIMETTMAQLGKSIIMRLDAMKKLFNRNARWFQWLLLTIVGTLLANETFATSMTAPEILKAQCGICHLQDGKLQRIDGIGKSPEGWEMTIARMYLWHKDQGALELSKEDRRTLVNILLIDKGWLQRNR